MIDHLRPTLALKLPSGSALGQRPVRFSGQHRDRAARLRKLPVSKALDLAT
jgi:hypothetical protein